MLRATGSAAAVLGGSGGVAAAAVSTAVRSGAVAGAFAASAAVRRGVKSSVAAANAQPAKEGIFILFFVYFHFLRICCWFVSGCMATNCPECKPPNPHTHNNNNNDDNNNRGGGGCRAPAGDALD